MSDLIESFIGVLVLFQLLPYPLVEGHHREERTHRSRDELQDRGERRKQ